MPGSTARPPSSAYGRRPWVIDKPSKSGSFLILLQASRFARYTWPPIPSGAISVCPTVRDEKIIINCVTTETQPLPVESCPGSTLPARPCTKPDSPAKQANQEKLALRWNHLQITKLLPIKVDTPRRSLTGAIGRLTGQFVLPYIHCRAVYRQHHGGAQCIPSDLKPRH